MILWLAMLLFFAGAISFGAPVEGLPAPGEPRHPVLAEPREMTLRNGLRVIVVERPALPLLSAQLIIRRGAETDPPRLAGRAHFTAALLKRGTANRSATQLAQDIEALGAKIETEAVWDATLVKLTTLAENAEPALRIVADLVRQPAFAAKEIERQRRERLDELRLALEEPGAVARLAAARAALGASPCAHPAEGTPAALARLTRQDIAEYHRGAFRPNNVVLVLAGSITSAEAFALAEKIFGDWVAPRIHQIPLSASPPPPASRVLLIDMPNAGQAAVFLAAPGIPRAAEDWFAGQVANTLLGGGYTSRLNQEIRLKRGLSYGARSTLATRRTSGLFMASAQTRHESVVEVASLIQAEIQRLASEPVPREFLQSRQSVLSGELARDLETNAGWVQRLGELALYDLPLARLGSFFAEVERVSAADLQAFAHRHFTPAAFTIVVAGQARLVEKNLRAAFPQLEVIPLSQLDLDAPALRAPARPR